MCDPGEKISNTLKREFFEEALDSLNMNQAEKRESMALLKEFFKKGIEVL
jgi:ADP-ribose pyrophosphatase